MNKIDLLIRESIELRQDFEDMLELNKEDIDYIEADDLNSRFFSISDEIISCMDKYGEDDELVEMLAVLACLNDELYDAVISSQKVSMLY